MKTPFPHPALQNDQMPDPGRQQCAQDIEVLPTLCQHHGFSPFAQYGHDIIADHAVTLIVHDHGIIQIVKLNPHVPGFGIRIPEGSGTHPDGVREGPFRRLLLGIHPISHGPTLHGDNWMMSILSHDRRRQSQHVFRFCPPRHLLETGRRKMMALVHHHMSIIANQIIHDALAYQTLNQGDIHPSRWFLPPTADAAN